MVAQLNYQKGLSRGLPGLIHDIGNTNIDSFDVVTAPLEYGVFVDRSGARGAVVGTAAAIGVSVRTASENTLGGSVFSAGEYDITETAGVLRSGDIYAQFDAAGGTIGDLVTINASGQVVAAGGGIALTAITATIESVAVDATQDATGVFVGRIKVNG